MRPSFCPTINELCQRSGQFEEMANLARRRSDPISFAAGLIQQKSAAKPGG
jgi:hypothetical protein